MITYEEERRRRVDENKRRLEESGIADIAKELTRQTTKPPKPQPKTRLNNGFVRRSFRFRSNPHPNYSEDGDGGVSRLHRSSGRSSRLNLCSQKDRMAALEAAEKIQQGLEHPSTVKAMLQSHVSGGFWLSLPTQFAKKYLPSKDTMMTLRDDDEQESKSLYLAYKNGLSGGWRGFAIEHQLQDGDALVFELVKPFSISISIFVQVHIVRVADYQTPESDPAKKATEKQRPAKRSRR